MACCFFSFFTLSLKLKTLDLIWLEIENLNERKMSLKSRSFFLSLKSLIFYGVFHGLGQAKFANGGSILGLRQWHDIICKQMIT